MIIGLSSLSNCYNAICLGSLKTCPRACSLAPFEFTMCPAFESTTCYSIIPWDIAREEITSAYGRSVIHFKFAFHSQNPIITVGVNMVPVAASYAALASRVIWDMGQAVDP